MFIVVFHSFLAGLELNLHRSMLSQKKKKKNVSITLSYDVEIFNGMIHNPELFCRKCVVCWGL